MSADEKEAGLEMATETAAANGPESGLPAGQADVAGSEERPSLDFVIDVPLEVTVEIGSASMRVKDVLQLGRGSVIPLDRMSGEPADILANGRLIARGEITVVDERLAIRVTQLMGGVTNDDAR